MLLCSLICQQAYQLTFKLFPTFNHCLIISAGDFYFQRIPPTAMKSCLLKLGNHGLCRELNLNKGGPCALYCEIPHRKLGVKTRSWSVFSRRQTWMWVTHSLPFVFASWDVETASGDSEARRKTTHFGHRKWRLDGLSPSTEVLAGTPKGRRLLLSPHPLSSRRHGPVRTQRDVVGEETPGSHQHVGHHRRGESSRLRQRSPDGPLRRPHPGAAGRGRLQHAHV